MEDPFLDHELKNADLKGAEIVSGLKLEIDKTPKTLRTCSTNSC